MKTTKTLVAACQILRARVRFRTASLRLPGTPFPGNDTEAIRAATRLYVDTWVVPFLDAIEAGDMERLERLVKWERASLREPADRPVDVTSTGSTKP